MVLSAKIMTVQKLWQIMIVWAIHYQMEEKGQKSPKLR